MRTSRSGRSVRFHQRGSTVAGPDVFNGQWLPTGCVLVALLSLPELRQRPTPQHTVRRRLGGYTNYDAWVARSRHLPAVLLGLHYASFWIASNDSKFRLLQQNRRYAAVGTGRVGRQILARFTQAACFQPPLRRCLNSSSAQSAISTHLWRGGSPPAKACTRRN